MTNLYVVDGEIAECSDREPSAVEPPARTGFRTIWYMEEDEDMLKEILERLRRSIAEKEVPEQEASPEVKEETIVREPEDTVLFTAEFVPLPETEEKVFVARYYIGK